MGEVRSGLMDGHLTDQLARAEVMSTVRHIARYSSLFLYLKRDYLLDLLDNRYRISGRWTLCAVLCIRIRPEPKLFASKDPDP